MQNGKSKPQTHSSDRILREGRRAAREALAFLRLLARARKAAAGK